MFAHFLVSVTVARTAVFALPMGLFFAAAALPSDAPAVLATASALTIGSALGLWPSGRFLDRIGSWRGLRLLMLAGAGSLALLALALGREWPMQAVLPAAVVSGASWSVVIATPRALLPSFIAPARLPWASGIEAASIEAALILAPVAGALLGRLGPAAVPVASASLLAASALLLPAPDQPNPQPADGRPLISRPVIALAGLALLFGVSGGLMEPGLAAMPATLFGDIAGNAVLFVAIGLGSAVGGLLSAHTAWPRRIAHSVPLFLLHAAALAGAAATDGLEQLGLLVAAGLPIAPLQSLAGLHLDDLAGPARASETFGIVATALTLGAGLGQAIAARVTTQLTAAQLVLVSAILPAAAAILVAGRRPRSKAGGQPR